MAESRHDLRVIENVLVGRPPADDATETTAFFDREAGTLYLPVEDAWVTPGGVVSGPPEAHAASHATAGSDPITPASIGAETPAGAQSKVDAAAAASSTALSTHEADQTAVHGIPNTADLETQSGAQTKADDAQSAAQLYADGVAATAQSAAEATAAGALAGHEADQTAVHGIADTAALALIDGSRPVSAINAVDATAASNTVRITPTANKSASTSAGGALLLTLTGSTGAGFVAYTNLGATAAGRMFVVRSDNTAFSQQAMFLQYKGTNHGFAIDHQGTGAASLALTVTSTNTDDTTAGFTGSQTGRAVLKVTHNGSASTGNAAGITVQLNGTTPATQGIFMDTTAGATGKLLNLRVNGSEMMVLHSDGTIENANGIVQRVCRIRRSSNQTVSTNTHTNISWNAETTDPYGWHDLSTNPDRVTPSKPGLYAVTGTIAWGISAAGGRVFSLQKNASENFSQGRVPGVFSYSGTAQNLYGEVELNGSSDYIVASVYQDSGGNLDLLGDSGAGANEPCRLDVRYLGPVGI